LISEVREVAIEAAWPAAVWRKTEAPWVLSSEIWWTEPLAWIWTFLELITSTVATTLEEKRVSEGERRDRSRRTRYSSKMMPEPVAFSKKKGK